MIAASDPRNMLKNHGTFRVSRRCDGRLWIERPITLLNGAISVSPCMAPF